MTDVNYRGALIAVADDCPVTSGVAPAARGAKKTLPQIQYEMLRDHPYEYTSAEVLFESNMRHKGVSPDELRARRAELWAEFFSKPQACLRASPLTKRYGYGAHYDAHGRIGLHPVESEGYARLAADPAIRQLAAMRSARAPR